MGFRLRTDARKWFKALDGTMTSSAKLFEFYYFSLAAGLAHGREEDASNENTDEIVDHYPGEFRTRGRILTAWLIATELRAQGISLHERTQVHNAIRLLVDPQSPSFLSELGMRKMNRYASGGFGVLSENFDEPPRTLPAFLFQFRKIVASGSQVLTAVEN